LPEQFGGPRATDAFGRAVLDSSGRVSGGGIGGGSRSGGGGGTLGAGRLRGARKCGGRSSDLAGGGGWLALLHTFDSGWHDSVGGGRWECHGTTGDGREGDAVVPAGIES